jgi:tryptophan-rich sensory protein
MTETSRTPRPAARAPLLLALLALAPSVLASALGGLATAPAIPTWYAGLAKPALNPPNWVFGPVWTLLYAILAYAFWRILRLPADTPGRGRAIALFLVQMALNAAWSWAFFGARSPDLGIAVIVLLWIAILLNMLAFLRLDALAGWLLAPYLAWVTLAGYLNVAVAVLNR